MKYIIIGGDAAGMSAAMEIIRNDKDAEILTLEKGGVYSYGQCGLPYTISGIIPSTDALIARSVDTFRNKYGIDAMIYHEVNKLDPEKKVVHATNVLTEEKFKYEYDKLLVATGASPHIPDWKGIDLKHVHSLKTIPDAHKIMNDMGKDINDITIVGGGYIGLEMAESFKMMDKHVRIIQRGKHLANIFDEDMALLIHEEASKQGIEVVINENVLAINGEQIVESIQTDCNVYKTDLVLIATGITPNTNFLKDTGIIFNAKNAIQVNRHMETSIKDIYAAGDCAVHYHIVKEKDDYIPLGTTANKQGRIAGFNMVGVQRPFSGITGSSIIKFMNVSLGKTGLSEKEAQSLNLPYEMIKLETNNIAGYYPGGKSILIKLIYRNDNHQLLGGQVIGEEGVDKRIDVLSTALFNRMTMRDLEDLDLCYAPPYNSTWDPIQQAARRHSWR
ncbi:CoA-disulfide reductase [Lederbergia lenta]|uniref:FAD-dependent pyridine nucleotide-disulfide oxidoreductase n=1 Tax=Lederbergia lenta TaxID=1467 RepID=A0A2X4W7G8_LEDLE|nr:CoA-disulfide reductase [Lederbergia lenta]MEC2324613.1 CoA-disulfide reductase [Lederbergia lenta]SQI59081.1 FAD-dependent pyridine nucleotide-disulfide oxidoreductase [Lederbergia lenta]